MAASAQGNGGGGTGVAIGLVFFAIAFVLTLLIAVLLWARLDDAENKSKKAQSDLYALINREQLDDERVKQLREIATDRKVVGHLLDENQRLKQMIDGSPEMTFNEIVGVLTRLEMGPGQTFSGEIRRLRSELVAAQDHAAKQSARAEAEKQRVLEFESEKRELSAKYEQAVKELQGSVSSLRGDFDQHNRNKQAQLQALESDLDSVRNQKQGQINELEEEVVQKDQEVAVLKKRVDELVRITTTYSEDGADPTRESDGRVTAVLGEENLVYIDRGRVDRVLLGMTFEVFDDAQGVQVDDFGDVRGLATVEVIDVSENASLARIVRAQRGKTIEEGNLIANIVYDPGTTFKFYVFGMYDIDKTGQATATDRRRIEVMINQWGGVLADKLSYETDFLVLGEEPPLPQQLTAGVIDPDIIEQRTKQMRLYKEYQDLVAEAKALSIPILNQNRFLALVGYYRR